MDEIKVLDKVFDLYIPYDEIMLKIDDVAKRMTADLEDENPLFLVMLNGAFMFASELMKRLNFAAELTFVKMTSYCGTETTGCVQELIGLSHNLKGRKVVIIEDIVDSGYTMKYMLGKLASLGAEDVKIACLFNKPNSHKVEVKIDYPVMEIGDDFIVGFGLDYNQYGRNLKSIYKVRG